MIQSRTQNSANSIKECIKDTIKVTGPYYNTLAQNKINAEPHKKKKRERKKEMTSNMFRQQQKEKNDVCEQTEEA